MNSKNTQPEIKVQKILKKKGIIFDKHNVSLFGTPDISIPSKKIILNIKGCFWHQHGCVHSKIPKNKILFWHEKFKNVKIKDTKDLILNSNKGWVTFDLWECFINDEEKINSEIIRILNFPTQMVV